MLVAACDDLVASRTLGPLHDAAAGTDGPLAAALAEDGPVDGVFAALLEELGEARPTVLVVEDVHWADDATLDVLGYAARRVEALGAAARPDHARRGVDPRHPLHRPAGRARAAARCTGSSSSPLSRDAVGALAAGTGRDADAVHALTRGNPFFVAETLAAPPDEVPASVKDAVLARLRGCSTPDCRDALERLSVVPSHDPDRPGDRRCWGRASARCAEAELAGLIEVRARTGSASGTSSRGGRSRAASRSLRGGCSTSRGGRGAARGRTGPSARGCCITRSRRATSTRCSP